jgi:hypothetical protein
MWEFWGTVAVQTVVAIFCYGMLFERVKGHGSRLKGLEGKVDNHETRISHLEGKRHA